MPLSDVLWTQNRPTPRAYRRASQHDTHRGLVRTAERRSFPTHSRLDAIIVPAYREAGHLTHAIELAHHLHVPLVILTSRDCSPGQVAVQLSRHPDVACQVIDIPAGYRIPGMDLATSSPRFRELSHHRDSDLSVKRNLGLLLARLHDWRKILFLDDDVLGMTPRKVTKIAAALDHRPIVGVRLEDYPDNSVVCHANRCLPTTNQDVFISGAALGVRCDLTDSNFFPDIYNEDWFFFARQAAGRQLAWVDRAEQEKYNPFEDPDRARREELGDLLAEGVYCLFDDGLGISEATPTFWSDFMEARARLIAKIGSCIAENPTPARLSALSSMTAAREQLTLITPDDCSDFIEALTLDQETFAATARSFQTNTRPIEGLDRLGLLSYNESMHAA